MKTTRLDLPVMASWMESNGRRLDCNPYLSGGFEARVLLELLKAEKQPLQSLTQNGMAGIFHAGREKRRYVDNPEHGVPFLGSTDILAADLSGLPFLSKKQVQKNPHFTVEDEWTLITRSGTVGRMAFVRPDMAGMACSEHVLRVAPDRTKILPGYLYAYLSSRFGVSLITSGTYGSIIQHLEPNHIADLPVPRLGDSIEAKIHRLVTLASEKRVQAIKLLEKSQTVLTQTIGTCTLPDKKRWTGYSADLSTLIETNRFDSFFYNPTAQALDKWIEQSEHGFTTLEELTEDIFDVPPFKHIYVDSGSGLPFFTSGDIFLLDRETNKYISKTQTKGLHKYLIKEGWLLLARSGQIGGIIGRPQYVDSALKDTTASDHVIRIVPKENYSTAGFLYTFLTSPDIGYHLLTRTMTGSSIPALWPKFIKQIKVPIVSQEIQENLDVLIRTAFELRVEATSHENEARNYLENKISKTG